MQLFFVQNPYRSREKHIHRTRFSAENSYPMYQDKKKHQKRGRKSPPFFRFKTPKPKGINFGQLTTEFLGGCP